MTGIARLTHPPAAPALVPRVVQVDAGLSTAKVACVGWTKKVPQASRITVRAAKPVMSGFACETRPVISDNYFCRPSNRSSQPMALKEEPNVIVIHHLGVSQSHRIVWLCEELELPYHLKRYERDPQTRLAPAEYRALHPVGTAPIISDGDVVLPESGAIMTYLIEKYGEGRLAVAPDAANYADYLFWFHFANGSLMPSLTVRMVLLRSGGNDAHPVVRALTERSVRAFDLVETRLGNVPYLAGAAFTAADIMMFFPLTFMRSFASIDLASLPHLTAYLGRLAGRAAFQASVSSGDPGVPTFGDSAGLP